MKNDQERENKLKEAIRDALSTVCGKDENGVFYEEIYADYRDTLDNCTLKKICNDDHPREKLWELLDEWYRDCEWEYADNVIKQVLKDENVAELVENPDADEIRELIRELAKEHTVILSSHILAEIQEVCDYIMIISKGKLVALPTSLAGITMPVMIRSRRRPACSG